MPRSPASTTRRDAGGLRSPAGRVLPLGLCQGSAVGILRRRRATRSPGSSSARPRPRTAPPRPSRRTGATTLQLSLQGQDLRPRQPGHRSGWPTMGIHSRFTQSEARRGRSYPTASARASGAPGRWRRRWTSAPEQQNVGVYFTRYPRPHWTELALTVGRALPVLEHRHPRPHRGERGARRQPHLPALQPRRRA